MSREPVTANELADVLRKILESNSVDVLGTRALLARYDAQQVYLRQQALAVQQIAEEFAKPDVDGCSVDVYVGDKHVGIATIRVQQLQLSGVRDAEIVRAMIERKLL